MLIPYNKLRVLVLEDHKFTRFLLKEVLYNLGCQRSNIHEAADGSAGLQLMEDKHADLII